MSVREELERREHRTLNPLAAFSDQSKGRPFGDKFREEDVRTCYQRDIDRIVHSKAFRRLMHKTQVFLCIVRFLLICVCSSCFWVSNYLITKESVHLQI